MKVENIVIDGIDTRDYPDFCDAYIESADNAETGEALTEAELDTLNEDGDFVHEAVYEWVF